MDGNGFWETALLYFLLGVFPWIFVAVGAWLLHSAHRFMKRAVRTTGTVVSVRTSVSTSSTNGSTSRTMTYCPTFRYADPDGLTQHGETFLSSSGYNFPVGSEREILIDPERGGKVRMPGFMIYGFGALFAGIGLIFGIVGIFALAAM